MTTTRYLLRAAALIIALLGAIDPALTSMRRAQPTVSVVSTATSAGDPLADRVAKELSSQFTIVRGPFAGAAAVVAIGDRLPAGAETISSPVFAVTPAVDGPAVRITGLQAPARAQDQARVPVGAVVRVEGARGRTLDITLRQAGLVVDRATRAIAGDADTLQFELGFVPTAEGVVPLTIAASVDGAGAASAPATADFVVDVRHTQSAVLFFDRRPSWMSTFVRRAIEADPRFIVTSRVVTSRNLSTDTGRPPGGFEDLPSLALFDAVVVGAPEELTAGDVTGLNEFLRRRGGAVCLLLDQRATGPYERLIDTREWTATAAGAAVAIDGLIPGAGHLMASEIVWPTVLPAGGRPVAIGPASPGSESPRRPVIWRAAVGSGRVVISGALDAWRFRDEAAGAFDRFWRAIIADAVAASPAPLDVRTAQPLLRPGESTDAIVTVRDVALANEANENENAAAGRSIGANVSVSIEMPGGSVAVRAWPDGPPGQFRAKIHAPDQPGAYRVSVAANGARTEVPLVVASSVARPFPVERDVIAAWTASRGGVTVPAARSREVGLALNRVLRPDSRLTTWHPMRSAWWMVPFATALGGEWWFRRRRGFR